METTRQDLPPRTINYPWSFFRLIVRNEWSCRYQSEEMRLFTRYFTFSFAIASFRRMVPAILSLFRHETRRVRKIICIIWIFIIIAYSSIKRSFINSVNQSHARQNFVTSYGDCVLRKHRLEDTILYRLP